MNLHSPLNFKKSVMCSLFIFGVIIFILTVSAVLFEGKFACNEMHLSLLVVKAVMVAGIVVVSVVGSE